MSPDDRLARHYRRLLLAYPRRYRRTRGEEIVTTLLDAAEPGQHRPRWRDAANLVVRGVRCRLLIGGGPGYAVVAGVFAAIFAFGVAAGVAFVAGAARLPSVESAVEVARLATPARPSAPEVFHAPTWTLGSGLPDADRPPTGFPAEPAWVQVTVPAAGSVADLVQARARLAADGWRVSDVATIDGVHVVWAAKGDIVAEVSGVDGGAVVDVSVFARTPSWVVPALAAGGVLGLVAGWLVAGFALRAFRRLGVGGRSVMLLLGVPGLLAGLAPLVYAVLTPVVDALAGNGAANVWYLLVSAVRENSLLVAGAVVAFAATGVVAATAPRLPGSVRAIGTEGTWRIGASAAAAGHLAFAVAAFAVVAVYLVMVWKTGQRPVTGAHDPKDLVPLGTSDLNPFMWAFDLVVVLYVTGGLLSPLLLTVSVPLLVTGRTLRLHAGRIRLLLLVAVATAVVPTLVMISPLGREAGIWLMD